MPLSAWCDFLMRENEDALRGALTVTEPTEAQFFSSWGPPGLQPAQLPIPFEGSQKRFLAKLHGKATGKNIGRSLPGCHIVWSLEDSQYVQWTLLILVFARLTQMSKLFAWGMPFRFLVFAACFLLSLSFPLETSCKRRRAC